MLENWISRMAVNPIFVLWVHLSEGFRLVHLCLVTSLRGDSGRILCFVTRVESVVTRVRREGVFLDMLLLEY